MNTTGFLEGLPDECKACIKLIFTINHINQEEIKEVWGVSIQNTQKFKHFILLMNNSAHLCLYLAIITRGIVCHHYFSLMMHTHAVTFHIWLIRKRWYKNPELNGKNEPFVYTVKFQNTELPKQLKNQEVPYLIAIIQNNVDKWDQKSKINLNKRIFYGKVMEMAKKVIFKVVENYDIWIFEIFKKYLDKNRNLENNDSRNNESDLNLDVESISENPAYY